MEWISTTAEAVFRGQEFGDIPVAYDLLDIISSPNGNRHELRRTSADILHASQPEVAVSTDRQSGKPNHPLSLTRVDFEPSFKPKFHTTATDFLRLFKSLNLPPFALYLISRDIMAFQQLREFDGGATTQKQPLAAYYLNYEALKIVWSYNPTTLSTKGIILTRVTLSGRNAYQQFCDKLDSLSRGDMVYHPLFPMFVALVATIQSIDDRIVAREQSISATELRTPYSPWSLDVPRADDVNVISECSHKMAAAVVELEDALRHMRLLKTMKLAFEGIGVTEYDISEDSQTLAESGGSAMRGTLGLLCNHLEAAETYAGYLRERAKIQLSMVSVAQANYHSLIDLENSSSTLSPEATPCPTSSLHAQQRQMGFQ